MKQMMTKAYNGVNITVLHDSRVCIRCISAQKFFDQVKKKQFPAKTSKNGRNRKVLGLISYLELLYKEAQNSVPSQDSECDSTSVRTCVLNESPSSKSKRKHTKNSNPPTLLIQSKKLIDESEPIQSQKASFKHRNCRNSVQKINQKNHVSTVTQENSPPLNVKKSSYVHKKASCTVTQTKDDVLPLTNNVEEKEPTIGTLKRKRWNYQKLKTNENYEDDLFAETKFYRFQNLIEEESNSSELGNMNTPKWSVSLSPRELSDSPSYEDCYSPAELNSSRKDAEEYQYRRTKRRSIRVTGTQDMSDSTKDTSAETSRTLQEACKILMRVKKEGCNDEDSDDYYFSDISEDEKML